MDTCTTETLDLGNKTKCILPLNHEGNHSDGCIEWITFDGIRGGDYMELAPYLGIGFDSLIENDEQYQNDEAACFDKMVQKLQIMGAALVYNEPEYEEERQEAYKFIPVERFFCKQLSSGFGIRSSRLAGSLAQVRDDASFLLMLAGVLGYLWC